MGEPIPAQLVAELEADLGRARAFSKYWAEHALHLMQKYGGQWVAFQGTTVVTHGKSAAAIEKRVRELRHDPLAVTVRYVPRRTDRYVLLQ